MRSLAFATLVLCGCPGKTMTLVEVHDAPAISVDVESRGSRRELLAARAASGVLAGIADATRGAAGAIDVGCASCFGGAEAQRVAQDDGRIVFDGAAGDLLAWQPDALRIRVPAEGGTARLALVVPKAALTAVTERRDLDRDPWEAFFYLGSTLVAVGTLLISLAPPSSGTARTVLLATGFPLGIIGLAGAVPGAVYVLSPSGDTQLYPPK